MNILVCIKQVPQTNKVDVDPITGVLLRNGVNSKMNPYDLYALETALRLREEYSGSVCVLSMGPPQAQQIIKEAYAIGADAGILLSDRRFGGADVLATSYTLSQGVRMIGDFDLILCGKQTTDGDTAQVGPALSEWLNIPCLSNVRRIMTMKDGLITVETDMLDVIQTMRVKLPCLLSVEKDIYQPRLPSYVKQKQSAERPIRILTLDDMSDQEENHYGLNGSPTQVERIFPPAVNDKRELCKGEGAEMARLLHEKLLEHKYV